MESEPNRKKAVLWVIIAVILTGLGVWLFRYFSVGQITITTNSPNSSVTLLSLSSSSKTYRAQGRLSLKLQKGSYVAIVGLGSNESRQVVVVSAHKNSTYSLELSSPAGVEPVIYQNAQSLSVASSLVFLDTLSHKLMVVNKNNQISTLNEQPFRSVTWGRPGFGVGQALDGVLYTIDGSMIKKLEAPFSYDSQLVKFDVSADNKIVVSHGSEVYSGSAGGSFSKIYSATTDKPVIAAGIGVAAVADATNDENATQKPLLAVISSSGKVIKKGIVAHRLRWSPGGKYLLDVDAPATIYSASLKQVGVLPDNTTVGSVQWLNDSTLLYSKNDQLWKYTLADQKATVLANMPLAGYITSISTSEQVDYAYLATTGTGLLNNSAVRKVGLKQQIIPQYVFQLQSILPLTVKGCGLSLVNFSSIRVVLQPKTVACIGVAKSTLQNRGFSLSDFTVGF